jgi:hypothetical protein
MWLQRRTWRTGLATFIGLTFMGVDTDMAGRVDGGDKSLSPDF